MASQWTATMSLSRRIRELPAPIGVAFATTLANRLGTMALPFLMVYLTEVAHCTPGRAGLVLGAYGAGSLVAGPLAGWAVSRVGARAVMIASLLGSGVLMLLFSQLEGFTGILVVTFAWAVSGEAFRPACSAVVAAHVPSERRREAFAIIRLAVNLGMTIGPLFGGFISEHSFTTLFVLDAVSSFAAAGFLMLPVGSTLSTPAPTLGMAASRTEERPAVTPLIVHLIGVLLLAMVAYQGLSTMALYMTQNLHLPKSSYGIVFALSGLIIVVLEVPLTTWLSGWSHRQLLVIGALLTAIGFAALSVAATLTAVIATTIVWTFGEMLLGPAAAARVADLEPSSRRGLYMGFYNAIWSASFALGPWLGSISFSQFGARTHWLIVGAVGLTAAAVFGAQRVAKSRSAETPA